MRQKNAIMSVSSCFDSVILIKIILILICLCLFFLSFNPNQEVPRKLASQHTLEHNVRDNPALHRYCYVKLPKQS
jgi:hypothetical protein